MEEINQEIAPAQEKMLSQEQVNQIVAREKQQAAAKARQEVQQEMSQGMGGMQQQQAPQQQAAQQQSAPPQANADAIYQQVQERFNRDQQLLKEEMEQRQWQEHASTISNSYHARMAKGVEAYQDFGDVTKAFDATRFPELVYLVANMDSAADVIYEVSKNPSKLVMLDYLAKTAPNMAQSELLKLSQSISANNTGKQEANNNRTNAPLDHVQPSRVSGSNGEMNVSDFRNQDWLRG